jgi:hypothetical protein
MKLSSRDIMDLRRIYLKDWYILWIFQNIYKLKMS